MRIFESLTDVEIVMLSIALVVAIGVFCERRGFRMKSPAAGMNAAMDDLRAAWGGFTMRLALWLIGERETPAHTITKSLLDEAVKQANAEESEHKNWKQAALNMTGEADRLRAERDEAIRERDCARRAANSNFEIAEQACKEKADARKERDVAMKEADEMHLNLCRLHNKYTALKKRHAKLKASIKPKPKRKAKK